MSRISVSSLASLSWVGVVAVALALSNYSLLIIGLHYGLPAYLAWSLSVPFDGGCLVAGSLTLRYARELGSNGFGSRFTVLILAGLSAWLNTEHATLLRLGVPAHVMYACPPVVAIVLFELSIRFEYRAALQRAGRTVKPLPVFGVIAWALHLIECSRSVWRITAARVDVATAGELQRLRVAAPRPGAYASVAVPHQIVSLPVAVQRPAISATAVSVAASHAGNAAATPIAAVTGNGTSPQDALRGAQTKSDAVRVALAENETASPAEIVQWLSERGISVNAGLVRSVRWRGSATPVAGDRPAGVTPAVSGVTVREAVA